MDLAVVCIHHFEFEFFQASYFIAAGKVAKGFEEQAADGVEFFVAKTRIEIIVEVVNGRECLHYKVVVGNFADWQVVVFVVLVFNFTHDLLENVLDGDEPAAPPYSSITTAM